jgi:PAS domain S-box-containing protein
MSIVDGELVLLRHPPLAALATSAWPAWLWSTDGSQIVWANAVGAAIFGAASASACTQLRFDAADASAAQIIRLAGALPTAGQERLERLRGFGASFGRTLTCACSRIVLADGKAGVLIAATEPAGPKLTLGERVRRLFADDAEPIAGFSPEGTLVYANTAAQTRLRGATMLSALGIETLAATVLETGSASGTARLGEASFDVTAVRLGKDDSRLLLLTMPRPPSDVSTASEPTIAPPPATAVAATELTEPTAEPTAAPVATTQPTEPTAEAAAPDAATELTEATAAPAAAPVATTQPTEPTAEAAAPDAATEPTEPTAEATAPDAATEPTEPTAPPAAPVVESGAIAAAPAAERRHPLRFVWQMDAEGRFGVGSDEFIELAGPHITSTFGRPWNEIADELKLDPDNQVARAIASRETWSGLVVSWPVDASNERLAIEMSGLPVFDRDRSFRGYRGFAVCRDIDRINQLARARREHQIGSISAPDPAPQQGAAAAAPENAAPATAAEIAPQPDRPAPSVAPAAANVVPFRHSPPAEPRVSPTLSPIERRAFRELAQELTARLHSPEAAPAAVDGNAEIAPAETAEAAPLAMPAPEPEPMIAQALLDRIPVGVLIYRHDELLYANRHFLEWSGYESPAAIEAAGGLNTLFVEPSAEVLTESDGANSPSIRPLSIRTQRGDELPAEGRMFTVPWNGASALALILSNGRNEAAAEAARRQAERALAAEKANRELKSIFEAATDGIVTFDNEGRIVGANVRAADLFGKAAGELAGLSFGDLLAPQSERAARDYFDRLVRGTGGPNNALDVAARVGEDRLVPLAMTLAPIGDDRICGVFRDVTSQKQSEEELRNAKREAVRAVSAKAEFLAKVSHEIRTPLNAMTGFAEVIMAERFGPIGNERYREYVKDIHAAGTHLVAMLNDLLDLSRIETGQIDLTFANVNLNELTQQCVGIMQPQANRARIIIRTSLTPGLPLVVADERSLRQIVLNLISNSIRFTGPGGQVIVSTVFTDSREAVLRVRDTGTGMSEKDIEAALEPFRQTATSGSWGSGGTGFGLPLTKALAEANRANYSIKSAPNAGTLIEIAFPPSRIVAD